MPPGACDPDHLVEEPSRVGDVLEHVRRERHVEGAVGHRQAVPVPGDGPSRREPSGSDGPPVELAPRRLRRLGRCATDRGTARRDVVVAVARRLGLGLDEDAACSGRHEGLGEVPGATADIHHELSFHGGPPTELVHGVRGLDRVEVVGVGLLDAKGPEQLDRAAQSPAARTPEGRSRSLGRGRHVGHMVTVLSRIKPGSSPVQLCQVAGPVDRARPHRSVVSGVNGPERCSEHR